jgi:hypothetical protein
MLTQSKSQLARVTRQLSHLEKRDWELWAIVSITGILVSGGHCSPFSGFQVIRGLTTRILIFTPDLGGKCNIWFESRALSSCT